MRNKKGSISDVLLIIVLLLGVSIFLVVVGYTLGAIFTALQGSELGSDPNSNSLLSIGQTFLLNFDYLFIVIFAGLIIGTIVSSYKIESSPIFIPIYFILLLMVLLIALVAQTVYLSLAEVETFSATIANKPFMNFVMSNLLKVAIGVGVITFIMVFAKPKMGDNL